jgi:hypothetical protein
MDAEGGTSMGKQAQKCLNNWVITVESSRERHQEIFQSTVARRAYEIFEQHGCQHGFDKENWVAAEKELLCDDFDGDASKFRFLIECPQDAEVTTILSMTTHSLIVFRSHARHVGEGDNGPEVLSVHILPEEIDPSQADVKAVDGLLHVYLPRKNDKGWCQKNGETKV